MISVKDDSIYLILENSGGSDISIIGFDFIVDNSSVCTSKSKKSSDIVGRWGEISLSCENIQNLETYQSIDYYLEYNVVGYERKNIANGKLNVRSLIPWRVG